MTLGTVAGADEPILALRPDAAPEGWHLAFEDDFERANLGDRWSVVDGNWLVENGQLTGKGQILAAGRFPGDQRLEFDAGSDNPGDLSGVLSCSEAGFADGLFLGFASDSNTSAKFLVLKDKVAAVPAVAEPNRTYHVVCQRRGGTLTLSVDGTTLLEYDAAELPAGPGHQKVGLYLWRPGWVDNVKVYVGSARAAEEARPKAFDVVASDGFDELGPVESWNPDPASSGWRLSAQGGGAVHIRGGAVEAHRPPDGTTTLTRSVPAGTGINFFRVRCQAPESGGGVNLIFRSGGAYLADIRIGPEHGIELRLGGHVYGRKPLLVSPFDFRPGQWYTLDTQFDFERDMVRCRLDEGPWTDWTPLLERARVDQIEQVVFYALLGDPDSPAFLVDKVILGQLPVTGISAIDYQVRVDRGTNTLALEAMLRDPQAEAEFMLLQGEERLGVLLLTSREFSFLSDERPGVRLTLIRDTDVEIDRLYKIDLQVDFDRRRFRAKVDNRSWTRWYGLWGGAELHSIDRVTRTVYSETGNPGGFLLDRLYARYRELPPPEKHEAASDALSNGGFEHPLPGLDGWHPDHWLTEFRDRRDRVEWVDDARTARAGHRFARISPASDQGLRIHNFNYGGLDFEPGVEYTLRFWARAGTDEAARVKVEPPGKEFEVTENAWTLFTVSYHHALTREPTLGFRFHLFGGPIDLDEVSALPADAKYAEPAPVPGPDVLDHLPVDDAWPAGFAERTVIEVTAVDGKKDVQAPVSFELRDLVHSHGHDFTTADHIRLVDASEPDRKVRWALREVDAVSGPSYRDHFVFLADMPPHSVKTFHFYLRDRTPPAEPAFLSTQLPEDLSRPSTGHVEARIVRRETRERTPEGKIEQPLLWGTAAIKRIEPGTRPRPGPLTIRAARGESEGFQVVVDAADEPLSSVTFNVKPFRHETSADAIEANACRLWIQEEVYLPRGNASVDGTVGGYKWLSASTSRAGWHRDPLLPHRPLAIPAGDRRACWVVLEVPAEAAAGAYTGAVEAHTAKGTMLTLPVQLEVFDFVLPRHRRFVPVLGADFRADPPPGSDRARVAMDLAVLFAEHNMAPWTYGMKNSCAYYVPWHYDRATQSGRFDFNQMDRNLETLIGRHNLRYLFFKFHQPGWTRPGYINDHTSKQVRMDSELGRDMLRVWLENVGAHLEEKGWLDRAHFYIADEIARDLDEATRDLAAFARETPPGMKTWALSAALGDWWTYMDQTDAFGGPISEANRARFERQGGAYWGTYNRPWLIGSPLWTTRVIGLDSYFRGATGYAHWAATRWKNHPWVNGATSLRPEGANPGIGTAFMTGIYAPGMDTLVYPWPNFEGAPERGDRSTVVPSIRMQALAEGIDDYEYAALLEETITGLDGEEKARGRALLDQLAALVEEGNLGGDYTHHAETHGLFTVDEQRFRELRADIGRFLGRHRNQAPKTSS